MNHGDEQMWTTYEAAGLIPLPLASWAVSAHRFIMGGGRESDCLTWHETKEGALFAAQILMDFIQEFHGPTYAEPFYYWWPGKSAHPEGSYWLNDRDESVSVVPSARYVWRRT